MSCRRQRNPYVPFFPAVHRSRNGRVSSAMPPPLSPKCPQEFPAGTPLLYFDEKTRSIVSNIPTELQSYDVISGTYKAPPGFSFVWLESLSQSLSPSGSPKGTGHVTSMLVPAELSLKAKTTSRSRSVSPEAEQPKKSKHERIEELLDWLETTFGEEGKNVYNQMQQAEGSNVLRVDIKTIVGVDRFASTLDDICKVVPVTALSTRSSLKRNKQRKGLSVYMKFQTAEQKQQARTMFEKACDEQMTAWIVKDIVPKE